MARALIFVALAVAASPSLAEQTCVDPKAPTCISDPKLTEQFGSFADCIGQFQRFKIDNAAYRICLTFKKLEARNDLPAASKLEAEIEKSRFDFLVAKNALLLNLQM